MKLRYAGLLGALLAACSSPQAPDPTEAHPTDPLVLRAIDAADASPGGRVTLATGQREIRSISVHDGTAYWTTFKEKGSPKATGEVVSCALAGCGGVPTVLASNQAAPQGLTIQGAAAYWLASGGIMSVPLSGGTPVRLATAGGVPYGLATDGETLYWTEMSKDGTNNGDVKSCRIKDCKPKVLATNQSLPIGVAVDSSNVYWANSNAGEVVQLPLSGGAAVTLATGQTPSWIAVNATTVYWTNDYTVMSCAIGGCGGAPTTLASELETTSLALDSSNVYFTDALKHAVFSVPLGGGATTLVSNVADPSTPGPYTIALSPNEVVWAGSQYVGAIPKP